MKTKKKTSLKKPHVFKKIETISITTKQRRKSIRINDIKVKPYDNHGVWFLDSQIEAVDINSLSHFNPVIVEFGESARTNKYPRLETIVAALSPYDEGILYVYLTCMDPSDLSHDYHESYQLALEKVVKDDDTLELERPVKEEYSSEEIEQLELIKKSCAEKGGRYNYSDVGYVCFSILIQAGIYAEVFDTIGRVVTSLDEKAKEMLKTQSEN